MAGSLLWRGLFAQLDVIRQVFWKAVAEFLLDLVQPFQECWHHGSKVGVGGAHLVVNVFVQQELGAFAGRQVEDPDVVWAGSAGVAEQVEALGAGRPGDVIGFGWRLGGDRDLEPESVRICLDEFGSHRWVLRCGGVGYGSITLMAYWYW